MTIEAKRLDDRFILINVEWSLGARHTFILSPVEARELTLAISEALEDDETPNNHRSARPNPLE